MSKLRPVVLAFVITACASSARNANPEARLARAATYSCVVSALRAGPLPVIRADSARGEVIALLREDAPEAQTQGVVSPSLSRDDAPSPYLVDRVYARIDAAPNGSPRLEVKAESGAGAGPRSGYVARPASVRARKAADAAASCGAVAAASNGGGPRSSSR